MLLIVCKLQLYEAARYLRRFYHFVVHYAVGIGFAGLVIAHSRQQLTSGSSPGITRMKLNKDAF